VNRSRVKYAYAWFVFMLSYEQNDRFSSFFGGVLNLNYSKDDSCLRIAILVQ
jgi:hypothetical protein